MSQPTEGDPGPDFNRFPSYEATYCLLFGIASLLTCLRSYVRTRLTKDWGWDDTINIIAWTCLLVDLVLLQILGRDGLGRNAYYVAMAPGGKEKLIASIRIHFCWIFVNFICILLTKISICLFILRVKNTRKLRWFFGTLMSIATLVTLPLLVIIQMPCLPFHKLWQPWVDGWCFGPDAFIILSYIQSGINIIVDLALIASPIVILWNIKISKAKKLLVWTSMSPALFATVTDAMRNAYIRDIMSDNLTFSIFRLDIVMSIEMNIGVIAACVPTLMPLFRLHHRHSSHSDTESSMPGRDYKRSTQINLSPIRGWRRSISKLTRPKSRSDSRTGIFNETSELKEISEVPVTETANVVNFSRPPTVRVDLGNQFDINDLNTDSKRKMRLESTSDSVHSFSATSNSTAR